ncbi:MAG: type II secretion system protein [Fibrobacter sp.]|nr:type II secretion system protein [Fibrobacter sp.]
MKKKNGFTLIEIMVVIVIMGVLAAVGVPKLFAAIAKAKASEVHTAAGTYIHAQDAYLHGQNAIGSWKEIGFSAPVSKVFDYSGCVQDKVTPQEGGESITGLIASNRKSLNECQANGAWALVMTPQGEHNVTYQQVVSSSECGALTPTWNVGSIANGDCSAEETKQAEPAVDPAPQQTETPEPGPETPTTDTPQDVVDTDDDDDDTSNGSLTCESLKKAYGDKQDKGKKNGWEYLSDCGIRVPPGKAKQYLGNN